MLSIGVPSSSKPTCCDEQFASWGKDYIQFVLSSFSEQYEWVLIRVRKRKGFGAHLTSVLGGIRYKKPLQSSLSDSLLIIFHDGIRM